MATVVGINVALRGLMELGIVAGLACWGYATGGSTAVRILLAVAAPLVVFGIWGLVDFRGAGRLAEGLRLAEELLLSGLAAVALLAAGFPAPAAVLAALSVVHHALVYATGQRLLKAPR